MSELTEAEVERREREADLALLEVDPDFAAELGIDPPPAPPPYPAPEIRERIPGPPRNRPGEVVSFIAPSPPLARGPFGSVIVPRSALEAPRRRGLLDALGGAIGGGLGPGLLGPFGRL